MFATPDIGVSYGRFSHSCLARIFILKIGKGLFVYHKTSDFSIDWVNSRKQELWSLAHGHASNIETRGRPCEQTKIVEGCRSYCVRQEVYGRSAVFTDFGGALLLYDLKTHDRIEPY